MQIELKHNTRNKMKFIDPSKESREWVEVMKKRWKERNDSDGNQPKKKKTEDYRLSKKDFDYNLMAKHIQHRCNGEWRKYSSGMHPTERFPEYKGLEIPLLKVTFTCTSCLKREAVFLLSNGSMIVGNAKDLATEIPEVPCLGVKNGFLAGGCYIEKIKIDELAKFEDPRKFTTPEELQNFEQHFPEEKLGLVARIRAKLMKGDSKEKRHRSLYNPGRSEYLKEISSLIKAISGCEVNLRHHQCSDKKFSELKDHEKIVQFYLRCRYIKARIYAF